MCELWAGLAWWSACALVGWPCLMECVLCAWRVCGFAGPGLAPPYPHPLDPVGLGLYH